MSPSCHRVSGVPAGGWQDVTSVVMSWVHVVLMSLCGALGALRSAAAQVPDPVAFFGHEVGADYKLINYTDMTGYFRAVEAASDRVRLVDIGPTSYGQRMVMAVITSKRNHARLERLREISYAMAHPGDRTRAEAEALAAEGCAVIWIDAGLHATETIAGHAGESGSVDGVGLAARFENPRGLALLMGDSPDVGAPRHPPWMHSRARCPPDRPLPSPSCCNPRRPSPQLADHVCPLMSPAGGTGRDGPPRQGEGGRLLCSPD